MDSGASRGLPQAPAQTLVKRNPVKIRRIDRAGKAISETRHPKHSRPIGADQNPKDQKSNQNDIRHRNRHAHVAAVTNQLAHSSVHRSDEEAVLKDFTRTGGLLGEFKKGGLLEPDDTPDVMLKLVFHLRCFRLSPTRAGIAAGHIYCLAHRAIFSSSKMTIL